MLNSNHETHADLTALRDEFGDVFSDVPGRTTLGVHHIELKPDTKPIRCAPYRLNQEKAKVLKDDLDNLLDPFPLPRIENLIDRVRKAKYLTKLDITRGY